MKKLLYIYNPAAGRRAAQSSLSDILEIFARQGYEITVRPTQERGDATAAVIQSGAEHDRVVCCGGDGTLNETVQGLLALPAERRPVLGYIPAGTTNDFSRTLELPKTLAELAEVAGEGLLRPIDVGTPRAVSLLTWPPSGCSPTWPTPPPRPTRTCWVILPIYWRARAG